MDTTNMLRTKLDNNKTILGAEAQIPSPTLIEVYGDLGLDFVWIDFEHTYPSPYDSTTLEELTRTAEAADIELLVRLPGGDPHLVRKVLDAGVQNLLIPRIEDAEEVQEAVKAGYFTYADGAGDRGVAASRSSLWGSDFDDYCERQDKNVVIGVMIENETAVENLEEILDVPNLGFIFIGPGDLSVSLGNPLEMDSPEVQDLIEYIRETSLEMGIPVGGIVGYENTDQHPAELGYQLLRIGDELDATREVLQQKINDLK